MTVTFVKSSNVLRWAKAGIFSPFRFISGLPKDLGEKYPDVYDPEKVEVGWYDWWRKCGHFKGGNSNSGNVFSMILPPPNVTGTLHLGHALTATIQDSLVRWHRMKGDDVVWVPGSDHAGIATQVVVEKHVKKETGKDRDSMNREEFLQYAWEWKESKGDRIFKQLEVLGASLDWDQTFFTMSEDHTKAVTEVFCSLFEKGLIYRGDFLVNWCCRLKSAISDIEVEHLNLTGKTGIVVPGYEKPVEFGLMYDFAYKVVGSGGSREIIVSTTRPETILGDVAVAVNPGDHRYADLVGSSVYHPFRRGTIPIVSDDHVDPNFETGAVKITPAHDQTDFLIGQRHGLPSIQVISKDGRIDLPCNHQWTLEELQSIPRFEARWKVIKMLKEMNLFRGKKNHEMSIPVCSRSGDVVEPLPVPQWFLSTGKMAKKALKVVVDGDLNLVPSYHKNIWESWLQNQKDWCLSRQLWWGHRIPIWRLLDKDDRHLEWICAKDEETAFKKAQMKVEIGQDFSLRQEEDVIDTWFSSGLLPFTIFHRDSKYYPLSLMETGWDILFFWVARMVMLGQEITDKIPFDNVMLHSMICDSLGRKMSKSLGNVIDPIHVVEGRSFQLLTEDVARSPLSERETKKAIQGLRKDFPQGIPKCGADALRFGLLNDEVKLQQINLDIKVMKSSSAFCNKLWQLVRYFLINLDENPSLRPETFLSQPDHILEKYGHLMGLEDLWILSQCSKSVADTNRHMENHDFHFLTRELRQLVHANLCDIYLETIKPYINQKGHESRTELKLQILHNCLITSLKLLHPFMPFITEELYQRVNRDTLPTTDHQSIMVQSYPTIQDGWDVVRLPEEHDVNVDMEIAIKLIHCIRSIKTGFGLTKVHRPNVMISSSQISEDFVEDSKRLINTLSYCNKVTFIESKDSPTKWAKGVLKEQSSCVFVDVLEFVGDDSVELVQKMMRKQEALALSLSKAEGPKLDRLKRQMKDLQEKIELLN